MAETYAQVEARIEQIIASINTESKLSERRLAHQHHVPIGRLRSRLAGAPSKSSMGGHNKKLFEAQELALCSYLSRLSRIGVNARRHMLQTAANTLLRQTHKHSKRKPPIVGQHWADISEDPAIIRGKYNASPYRYARPDTWGGSCKVWKQLTHAQMDEYHAKMNDDAFGYEYIVSSPPIDTSLD